MPEISPESFNYYLQKCKSKIIPVDRPTKIFDYENTYTLFFATTIKDSDKLYYGVKTKVSGEMIDRFKKLDQTYYDWFYLEDI
jgi:hypothetical protein